MLDLESCMIPPPDLDCYLEAREMKLEGKPCSRRGWEMVAHSVRAQD